jgi:F0F1-type ATP synthase assembly protein I
MREGGPPRDDRSALARGLAQAQMGFQLVAAMVGMGALGFFADRFFGTRPWLTLAGLVAGTVGGMMNFIHQALHPDDDRRDGGGASGKSDTP